MADQDLKLTIKADTTDASTKLEGLGASIGRMTAAFTLGSLATRGIEAAFGFLKNTVTDSIAAWNESERVTTQLNAVLESTQHAAGMSAKQLIDLSQSLEHMTTFSDEAVLSAENLLLTFTNIGKDVFPQATTTVLDMATALGEDTSSAAIQLGKALQDPILGITALRRVGVNFTTAQQEQIKTMVETNHTLDAQKTILAELAKEFGGSATAQAKTFEGQMKQLRNTIDDLEEGIGHGLTAGLYNLFDAFKQTNSGMDQTADLGLVVFNVFRNVTEGVIQLYNWLDEFYHGIIVATSYIVQLAGGMANFSDSFRQSFENMRNEIDATDSKNKSFLDNLISKNEDTAQSFGKMTADAHTFSSTGPAAYQQTKQAAEEAATKIKDANKAISDTKTKIQDLQESFLQGASTTAESYADAYVKQEQKVKDLKKQLLDDTAADQQKVLTGQLGTQDAYNRAQSAQHYAELNASIAKEQAALDNAAQLKLSLGHFVSDAQAEAQKTDFERTVDNIAKKYQQEVDAYLKKFKLLQQELSDNQDKRDKLAKNEESITTKAVTEATARTTAVVAEANKQVSAANQVASAWSNAYFSMSKSNYTPVASFANSTPAVASRHEFGGTVPGLKGAPTLVIAHGGETVIPAGQSGGGVPSGVVVNINYPEVRNEDDLDRLRRNFEEVMRPLLNNAKLIYT